MKKAVNFNVLTAILSIALMICTGCTKIDDPVDNNGDDPNNPNNPGDTTAVYKSEFKKKVFNTPEEIMAFITPGIYECSGNAVMGFGTDGSYAYGIYDNQTVKVCLNKGAVAYNVIYDIDPRADDNPRWVRQEYYNVPATGSAANAEYIGMSITIGLTTPLLQFITSDLCEQKPTHIYDDKVAGVDVKDYVYEYPQLGAIEYWITSTGLCLKYKITSTAPSEIAITRVISNVGDFNSILTQLPKFPGAKTTIPDYYSLYRITYGKYANEWLSDQYPRELDKWIIPYSGSGKIEVMEVWHDWLSSEYDGWTNIYTTVSGVTHQDILDYVNLVMTIENMKQTSFIDQEANGARFFSLKADNSRPSGSYIAYEITNFANDVYLIHIRLWIGYIV